MAGFRARWRRIRQLLIKELIQVFRDRKTRTIVILPPLLQLIIYGYAANYDVKDVPMAVYDQSMTQSSRDLIERFTASPEFRLEEMATSDKEVAQAIDSGRASMGLVIPWRFATDLKRGEQAQVQVIIDGTDSNAAFHVARYVGIIVTDYNEELMERGGGVAGMRELPVDLRYRAWFNPNLESRWFLIPGVIAVLSMLVSLSLTAMAVAREKELGTMEQLMVTPIRPVELVIGKTLPFAAITFGEIALVSLVGIFWFEVPFRGSVLVLILGAALFFLNSLGLGLLISTLSATQQQAMITSSFIFTPAILLSGFIFPITNMPLSVQYLTYLNPLRYFITVVHGVFLKGVGVGVLWPELLSMGVLGAFLLTASAMRFRKRLA